MLIWRVDHEPPRVWFIQMMIYTGDDSYRWWFTQVMILMLMSMKFHSLLVVNDDSHICQWMMIHTDVNNDSHKCQWWSTQMSMMAHTNVNDDSHKCQWWFTQMSMMIHTDVYDKSYRHQWWFMPIKIIFYSTESLQTKPD